MPQIVRKQYDQVKADAGGPLRRSGVRASGRAKREWFDETMAMTPTDEHDQGWITEMGDAPVGANHKLPQPLSRYDPVQFRTWGKSSHLCFLCYHGPGRSVNNLAADLSSVRLITEGAVVC